MTSFSRQRRFGKSFAAKMLCAYYDKSCDSRILFEGLEISEKDSFEKYLNKYDVIYLDITWFIFRSKNKGESVVLDIQTAVIKELGKSVADAIDFVWSWETGKSSYVDTVPEEGEKPEEKKFEK